MSDDSAVLRSEDTMFVHRRKVSITSAYKRILNRHSAIANATGIINLAKPLLEELVNYGTGVLWRCVKFTDLTYDDLPAITLYQHTLEMTDAIEVLLSNSCAEAMAPLCRAAYEGWLSLEYLLTDESTDDRRLLDEKQYKERSLAWRYCDLRKRIERQERLNPESEIHRKFVGQLCAENLDLSLPELPAELPLTFWNEQREKLTNDVFAPMHQRYEAIKKDKPYRYPSWYELVDGSLTSLRKLENKMKRQTIYDTAYGSLSEVSHAGDSSRYIKLKGGTPAGHQLRYPKRMKHYALLSSHYIEGVTDLMVAKFRPGEINSNYHRWKSKVRGLYDELDMLHVEEKDITRNE
jgi:hypothetical protein